MQTQGRRKFFSKLSGGEGGGLTSDLKWAAEPGSTFPET